MSAAKAFQQRIGAELAEALDDGYTFLKSKLELRADAPGGSKILQIAGSTRYSPHITVTFYFSRSFAAVMPIAKRIDKSFSDHHISQSSMNCGLMEGLGYAGSYRWDVDINNPPNTLVPELVDAVHGIADPFFKRFADIASARDALASNDSWCFGGKAFWKQLLLVDMTINDLPHFEGWAKDLKEGDQRAAAQMIKSLKEQAEGVV